MRQAMSSGSDGIREAAASARRRHPRGGGMRERRSARGDGNPEVTARHPARPLDRATPAAGVPDTPAGLTRHTSHI
ncbi:hypothetical protein GCM10023168_08050 [Fodinibacter luteus]|uniref:Uncharacterized protein n=1 Tax=Fodinibacter luteus TaxID=552064 RepID=A0ABP8K3C9_9MICO